MNKNDIKSKKTKKKLCNAFIELYNKKNIEQITIKEITNRAGYNRSTFYIYYRDVYDIHEKIKKDLIQKIQKKTSETITTDFDLTNIVQTLLSLYLNVEKYITPYVLKDTNFVLSIKENIKPKIIDLLKINDDNSKKRIDYLIEYHLSAVLATITLWISNKKDISLDELLNLILEISSNGVIAIIKSQKK